MQNTPSIKLTDYKDKDAVIKEYFETGVVRINIPSFDELLLREIIDYFGQQSTKYQFFNVTETELFRKIEIPWHKDQAQINGVHGTLLAFIECDEPTWTEFADCNLVYDNLSEEDKNYFEDLVISYSSQTKMSTTAKNTEPGRVFKEQSIDVPIIITHPVTGKKSVYYSIVQDGHQTKPLDPEDIHKYYEPIRYKHWWNPGDVLLWDNLRVIHRRPSFECHRLLRRICFEFQDDYDIVERVK